MTKIKATLIAHPKHGFGGEPDRYINNRHGFSCWQPVQVAEIWGIFGDETAMKRLSVPRASILFALIVGLWHAVWFALISLDQASSFVAFILWISLFELPVYVQPPSLLKGVLLTALASLAGAVAGWGMALLWNRLAHWAMQRRKRSAAALRASAAILGADTE